jgi:hypothetical protein
MYYKLIRHTQKGKSVHGTLYRVQHRFSQHAGQYKEYLTRICETLENADYLVPPLIYKIEVTQSPRFKRLLPIAQNVPQRSGIRIHRGSKPEHSSGCVLVVADNTLRGKGIGRSAADVERELTSLILKAQQEHEEIILEVSDFRAGTEYGYNHPCERELQQYEIDARRAE